MAETGDPCPTCGDRWLTVYRSHRTGDLYVRYLRCPDVVADWHKLVPLAEVGSRYLHDSERFLAATHFRAGNLAGALETYQRVERLNRLRAFDLFLLAMTHHELGQNEEAKRRLEQAESWIQAADRRAILTDTKVESHPEWGSWTERPLTLALQRQAVHADLPDDDNAFRKPTAAAPQ